jgi:hypothetical protein
MRVPRDVGLPRYLVGHPGNQPSVPGTPPRLRAVSSANILLTNNNVGQVKKRLAVKEESISFLKKRNKKLLSIARGGNATRGTPAPHETDKSFLVLFFKKEQLPCLRFRP